jgi:hypothetical protein
MTNSAELLAVKDLRNACKCPFQRLVIDDQWGSKTDDCFMGFFAKDSLIFEGFTEPACSAYLGLQLDAKLLRRLRPDVILTQEMVGNEGPTLSRVDVKKRSRNELLTTVTDESAMAAAAKIGICSPRKGMKGERIAIGISSTL